MTSSSTTPVPPNDKAFSTFQCSNFAQTRNMRRKKRKILILAHQGKRSHRSGDPFSFSTHSKLLKLNIIRTLRTMCLFHRISHILQRSNRMRYSVQWRHSLVWIILGDPKNSTKVFPVVLDSSQCARHLWYSTRMDSTEQVPHSTVVPAQHLLVRRAMHRARMEGSQVPVC